MKTIQNSTDLENALIAVAGEMAVSISVNRLVGQLYALLYISPDPVSLDQMVERLKISKGSASVNIRTLEEWNAVKTVWVQGSRKDYYAAETDLAKIVLQRLETGLAKRLSVADEHIQDIQKQISILESQGAVEKNKADFYKERIKKMTELKDLADKVLKRLPQFRSLTGLLGLASLLKE